MKRIWHFINSLYFSKEKKLLIKLLEVMRENLNNKTYMSYAGMCYYIHNVGDSNDAMLLHRILYDNAPAKDKRYQGTYFFPLYEFKPREEFLLNLIKKY